MFWKQNNSFIKGGLQFQGWKTFGSYDFYKVQLKAVQPNTDIARASPQHSFKLFQFTRSQLFVKEG